MKNQIYKWRFEQERHFLIYVLKGVKSYECKSDFFAKKYARIVELYAKKNNISSEKALDVFYRFELYELMSEGISDMHCMSDDYLVQELKDEIENTKQSLFIVYVNNPPSSKILGGFVYLGYKFH